MLQGNILNPPARIVNISLNISIHISCLIIKCTLLPAIGLVRLRLIGFIYLC